MLSRINALGETHYEIGGEGNQCSRTRATAPGVLRKRAGRKMFWQTHWKWKISRNDSAKAILAALPLTCESVVQKLSQPFWSASKDGNTCKAAGRHCLRSNACGNFHETTKPEPWSAIFLPLTVMTSPDEGLSLRRGLISRVGLPLILSTMSLSGS